MDRRIAKAIDLARDFATLERGQPCPREFSDSEMLARVVPNWVSQELIMSPEDPPGMGAKTATAVAPEPSPLMVTAGGVALLYPAPLPTTVMLLI